MTLIALEYRLSPLPCNRPWLHTTKSLALVSQLCTLKIQSSSVHSNRMNRQLCNQMGCYEDRLTRRSVGDHLMHLRPLFSLAPQKRDSEELQNCLRKNTGRLDIGGSGSEPSSYNWSSRKNVIMTWSSDMEARFHLLYVSLLRCIVAIQFIALARQGQLEELCSERRKPAFEIELRLGAVDNVVIRKIREASACYRTSSLVLCELKLSLPEL